MPKYLRTQRPKHLWAQSVKILTGPKSQDTCGLDGQNTNTDPVIAIFPGPNIKTRAGPSVEILACPNTKIRVSPTAKILAGPRVEILAGLNAKILAGPKVSKYLRAQVPKCSRARAPKHLRAQLFLDLTGLGPTNKKLYSYNCTKI